MELRPESGETLPSVISRDFVSRMESVANASPIDPTEVYSLLNEAIALPIRDERDLEEILRLLESFGRHLLGAEETELGLAALTAAADIILSAIRLGLPPRCAVIFADRMQGLGLDEASIQFLAATRAAVEENGGGDLSLHLAQIDNTIGNQYRMGDDLDLAETSLQQALKEFETTPGGPPALHSSILNNLGLVLLKKGHLKEAGELLIRSLEIEEGSDRDSKAIAINWDNLAYIELELARGRGPLDEHLGSAERYLERAKAAFQTALPDAETDYAICLGNVVELARCRNDTETADHCSREALEILERTGDKYALWAARRARAAVLYEQGNWASVVDLLGPIAEVPAVPAAAEALIYLARAAARMGDPSMSLMTAMKIVEIDDRLILDRMQAISEAEALHIFGPFSDRLETLLGLGLSAEADGELADWLYEVGLNRTGLLFERFGSGWSKAYSAEGAPAVLVERVRSLRAAAARADLDGADARSIYDARRRHEEAARLAGRAEAELLGAVGQEAPMPALIAPDDVRAALDADTLLLDFAFVQTIEGASHYAVFIVRKDGPVEYRDLGPAKEINELIGALEEGLGRRSANREMYWGDGGNRHPVAGENGWAGPAEKLSALLFPHDLELPTRLRVSPIGHWSYVPFSLLAPRGRPLVDDHLVSYVPSGRWLGARAMAPDAPDGGASPPMVMGDPDYDLVDLSALPFPMQMRFGQLPHAAIEVREVAARLRVELKAGKEANRDALANLRSPFILHLATHGKMLDAFRSMAELAEPTAKFVKAISGVAVSDERSPTEGPLGVEIPGFSDDSPQGRHQMRVKWLKEIGPRDPLSRSLIVLAGANAWVAGLDNPPEIGTGLMTAGEFALTDLSSTGLVVLSACDTGSGAVNAADGTLLGLRSASLLAGAASCLTALWPVDDEATTELILAFYAALERGARRDEALQEAQLAVRESRTHPYYWAAWVLDGEYGVLPAWPGGTLAEVPSRE